MAALRAASISSNRLAILPDHLCPSSPVTADSSRKWCALHSPCPLTFLSALPQYEDQASWMAIPENSSVTSSALIPSVPR